MQFSVYYLIANILYNAYRLHKSVMYCLYFNIVLSKQLNILLSALAFKYLIQL